MKTIIDSTYDEELQNAVEYLKKIKDHEEGGIILKKNDQFKFIPCKNISDCKKYIYVPDMNELFEIMDEDDECTIYGSVHNHPFSPAIPSHIDVEDLFKNFVKNSIFSNVEQKLVEHDTHGYVSKVIAV